MEVPFEESNPLYNYPVTEALMSNKTIQLLSIAFPMFIPLILMYLLREKIQEINENTITIFPNHDISIITSSMFLSSLMLCSIWNKVKQSSTISFILVLIPQIFTCLIVLDKLRCYQADYTDALGGLLLGGLFGGLSFASLFRLE
ncbi:hypothetical protein QTN25_003852 [Entamoeba marina]